jgi:UMF1 family MFS transporter
MRQLAQTFREIQKYKSVVVFLFAYWLYIDAVDTIVSMATKVGKDLGFSTNALITALLLVQFVAFPAAVAFGFLGQKIGTRRAIYIALVVYTGVCVWAWRMNAEWEFYVLAIAIALVQGGVQSLSRSYYSRLIPQDKAVEFFGFYNMLGKFAALLGPFLVGQVGLITHRTQDGVLALTVMLIGGGILLWRVREV